MSQYIETLDNGDIMLMEGPKGRLTYYGFGKFKLARKEVKKTKIGCVAGGTGITPCYQVIQAALKNEDDTHLSLVFGNRSIDDILLHEELASFA